MTIMFVLVGCTLIYPSVQFIECRMKVVVLGASGDTGLEVVKEGLARGMKITAGVRDPAKMDHVKHDNFSCVKVDIFSAESMASVFAGHDAVVSAVGFPKSPNKITSFSEMTPLIVSAMRTARVKRLLVISAWFTDEESRSHTFFQNNWKYVPGLVNVLDDQCRMEEFLNDHASDIWWAAIKPGTLSWGEGTGRDLKYKIGGGVMDESFFIRRADLARGMLDVVVSGAMGKVAIGEKCSKEDEKAELRAFQGFMKTMQEKTIGKDAPDMTAFFDSWEKMIDQK